MTVPNLTANRGSPEDPSRGFVPVREFVERLMGGLPSSAAVERQGNADPIQDWEFHGPAPHSAALPAPASSEAFPPPEAEAPDAVQLSLALDADARPDWPAVRYFEDRGLHHRHWKAARRVPWLQINAENSLAAFAYMDVARRHYEALLADWLPPATWTVVDGRGRLSVAWALRSGVHWNPGSWAWRRRVARTIDHELAGALGARRTVGRNIDAPIPRALHANPAASPSPWQHVRWTGERYRLRHLDSRSRGSSGVVTARAPSEVVTGRAAGGLASGSARQAIAAERRALVAARAEPRLAGMGSDCTKGSLFRSRIVSGALDSKCVGSRVAAGAIGSRGSRRPPASGTTTASANAAIQTNLRGWPVEATRRSRASAPAATSTPISAA